MKYILIVFVTLFITLELVQAQSVDRFIRIVGSSKHEFISDGVKIEFQLSEIQENSRNQTSGMPFDSVYYNFVKELSKLGIKEEDIELNSVNLRYNNFSKVYSIFSNNQKITDKISSLKIDGVVVSSILYTYSTIEPQIIENLILSAIDDAKRKAQKITQETNLKLGKILNIEDSSGGCCNEIKETKELKTTKMYNVNITFELEG